MSFSYGYLFITDMGGNPKLKVTKTYVATSIATLTGCVINEKSILWCCQPKLLFSIFYSLIESVIFFMMSLTSVLSTLLLLQFSSDHVETF